MTTTNNNTAPACGAAPNVHVYGAAFATGARCLLPAGHRFAHEAYSRSDGIVTPFLRTMTAR